MACGHLDILINNAADTPGGSLLEIEESAWRDAWELKVFGYINLTRAVLPGMIERRSGVVVNVVGTGGVRPTWSFICGATAKCGADRADPGPGGRNPTLRRTSGGSQSFSHQHR